MTPENKNHPTLTAYVLDELNDSERQEIETLLETDLDARRELQEIKRTINMMEFEFSEEPKEKISAVRKEKILESIARPQVTTREKELLWSFRKIASTIAFLFIAGFSFLLLQPRNAPDSEPLPTPADSANSQAPDLKEKVPSQIPMHTTSESQAPNDFLARNAPKEKKAKIKAAVIEQKIQSLNRLGSELVGTQPPSQFT